MFSQPRQPAKKQKLAQISRILDNGSSTPTPAGASGASASGPSNSTSAASSPTGHAPLRPGTRPPVKKVATVTRTVPVVKRVIVTAPPTTPATPPRSRLIDDTSKRKAVSDRASPAKVRKVDPPARVKTVKSVSARSTVSADVSPGERDAPSGDEVDTASQRVSGRREHTALVERSVAAELDGNVQVISGEDMVIKNLSAYTTHFVDLADPTIPPAEWAGHEMPLVTLELPGIGARERLLLLAPVKAGEEYDPISDVIESIRLGLDFYLTADQAQLYFGHTQSSAAMFAFLSEPSSRSWTPTGTPDTPLMRQLEKCRAKGDGPGFIAAVERYNVGRRALKAEGRIAENIEAMKGVPEKVWSKIIAQIYERAVGPEIEELRKYEAFSDNVYGELLPKFMSEIFQQTQLGPNSVFVDLGSGVGNCVVQAALATGCEAWGFENMAHASTLARRQIVEAESRFRLWGLKAGKMRAVEADFCACPDVNKVLERADVVLVNNEVFSSGLNNRLSLLFLELPQGARIISLKAFASSFTLSAYNKESPLAILDQGPERHYGRKSVSWKDEGGTYYIARVDRRKLEKFLLEEKQRHSAESQSDLLQ